MYTIETNVTITPVLGVFFHTEQIDFLKGMSVHVLLPHLQANLIITLSLVSMNRVIMSYLQCNKHIAK